MAKVLIIGSGGREHALGWKLAQSPQVEEVLCLGDNAGMASEPKMHQFSDLKYAKDKFTDIESLVRRLGIDLTIVDEHGKRKYRGDKAVRKAILAGERELRATTHLITEEVDGGPVLMVSAPLSVELPPHFYPCDSELVTMVAEQHQARLKEVGDWVIFPRTLQYLAGGRFAKDEAGLLHFDGRPIPNGVRL